LDSAARFLALAANSCSTPMPTATMQMRVTAPRAMLVMVSHNVDGSFMETPFSLGKGTAKAMQTGKELWVCWRRECRNFRHDIRVFGQAQSMGHK
jgi:hypothetical protein